MDFQIKTECDQKSWCMFAECDSKPSVIQKSWCMVYGKNIDMTYIVEQFQLKLTPNQNMVK